MDDTRELKTDQSKEEKPGNIMISKVGILYNYIHVSQNDYLLTTVIGHWVSCIEASSQTGKHFIE